MTLGPSDGSTNITWHDGYITREDCEKLHGHKGAVVWFTGLSASGKSTLLLLCIPFGVLTSTLLGFSTY